LEHLLHAGRDGVEQCAAAIRRRGLRFAVLAARGSSDNAARYAQYVLGVRNGLVVALAAPSIVTHYGGTPAMGEALVVGISQSGQSPDIVEVLRLARRQGALTLAITNDPTSPLALAAELVVALRAGEERAVAATKTYSAQLMAVAMLSAALQGASAAWDELAALPAAVQATLAGSVAGCNAAAERLHEHARLIVVGRGYHLATVSEVALKIKETSGVMADGYSSADFLHGPKALLEAAIPLLAVAPGPRVFADLEGVLQLPRAQGAPLVALSDRPEVLAQADVPLVLPAVPEWLSPLVAIVPGQLLALALSLRRGHAPDAPPGLSKVTLTR
jgi:glucosamine--fructose-6-phosphate aminotransferase (isomerizing)